MHDAPRLRLAKDIDLLRADPRCERCAGTGIVGKEPIELPDSPGVVVEVSKICRCVTQNGGIEQDALDRVHAQVAQQLADGQYAEHLASEVRELPIHRRAIAISKLADQLRNERTDPQLRAAIEAALELLSKETHHGHAIDPKV